MTYLERMNELKALDFLIERTEKLKAERKHNIGQSLLEKRGYNSRDDFNEDLDTFLEDDYEFQRYDEMISIYYQRVSEIERGENT